MTAIAVTDPPPRLTAAACQTLDIPRSSLFRHRARLKHPPVPRPPRPSPPRKLTAAESQVVCDLLHEPRFADQAPAEIYATLLDEGRYHCSIRTLYRILSKIGEGQDRKSVV